MQASLSLISPLGVRMLLEVQPGHLLEIGRASLQQLGAPPDPGMSAKHFAIAWDGGQCWIRDLGSRNGTFVNYTRVTDTLLRDGDRRRWHLNVRRTHG